MILEVALLNVRPLQTAEFEAAFTQAASIIASIRGYVSHELQRCLEVPRRYVLLVRWQTLADHTIGFRASLIPLRGLRGHIGGISRVATFVASLLRPIPNGQAFRIDTPYGRQP